MPDIGKAYVQIVPSAKGIGSSLKSELGGAGGESGSSFGLAFAGLAKKVIAGAAIGVTIKKSLDAGGALQQSFGGLDTLYGDAAKAAKDYAYAAAQAGISANSYAEQAVSFGAGLKAAFGGNTAKAVESANTAILDMADNAAKMGTPIENIQNAYQGFAKQNYTMLDNLKLGYGGTKKEMERLLADANAINAEHGKMTNYSMENLGDVYEAIHVVQDELGLTGVAADEASGTFTGSMGAMKASAQNLLANLSLGKDISAPLQSLVGNTKAFLINNLLPMIGNVFKQIPALLSGTLDIGRGLIQEITKGIKDHAKDLVEGGVDLVKNIATGLIDNAVMLIDAAIQIGQALWDALKEVDWLKLGNDLMTALKTGLSNAATTLFGDGATVDELLSSFMDKLGDFIEFGGDIVVNIATGITDALPDVISKAGELINKFANAILENTPKLLTKGVEVIKKLIEGISNGLPQIGEKAGEVIANFLENLINNLPQILETGLTLIGELAAGIIKAIPKVIEACFKLGQKIGEKFAEMDWKTIGQDILAGIAQGLVNFGDKVVQAAKDAARKVIDAFKDLFGIHSPSTVMRDMALDLIQGLINGINSMIASAKGAMGKIAQAIINAFVPTEWINKGKELGNKLSEGISQAKENIKGALTNAIDYAKGAIDNNAFLSAGAGIGNAFANGIRNSKQGALNEMNDLVNKLKAKADEAQRHSDGVASKVIQARLSGSVGDVSMYGSVGGETLSTENEVLSLLERYLPIITQNTGNSQYDAINRQMGWSVT